MTIYLQRLSCSGALDSTALPYIFSASGQGGFRSGWPTCKIVLPTRPDVGDVGDSLVFTAMGEERFSGYCTGIEQSESERTATLLGKGWLALADEPAARMTLTDGMTPEQIIDGILVSPTDEHITEAALHRVGGIFGFGPATGIFGGTGSITQPDGKPWPKWEFGTTAWEYVRRIDRLSGYRVWTHLVDGPVRTEAVYGSGGLTAVVLDAAASLRGATGGIDRYRRASVPTYITDVLSWGDGHAINLPEIGIDGTLWCQDLNWRIGPDGWTQTPSYATTPE